MALHLESGNDLSATEIDKTKEILHVFLKLGLAVVLLCALTEGMIIGSDALIGLREDEGLGDFEKRAFMAPVAAIMMMFGYMVYNSISDLKKIQR